ncbi:helix-turn-helix domain-containing protein [Actinospica sp.]|uniref:PucR family transcriptional regulator n=1 Tax=Actinospica sp. TaxID=1872142 RepID=UPI002CCC8A27|nr:helix-turn-helix domain-containing protein [Actinospica sp.]HWG28543.1 helix-turn-helix domain-containing protein [Actinospica sp.]
MARRDDARPVRLLTESMLLRVPALTDLLVRTIYEQNPAYRRLRSVPREDLWRSCHDNITRIVQLIADVDDAYDTGGDERFDAAHATGSRRAQQRMPLEDVIRSFRLGGRFVRTALIEQARVQGEVDTDALLELVGRVWDAVDAVSSEVEVAYHNAERQLVRADEQRRAALWEGLLQGRAKDLAFAHDVARTIGLPVGSPYVVAVVDAHEDGERSEQLVTRVRQALASARIESAWQMRADALVGLMALGEHSVDAALAALRESLRVPAGVSGVVSGLAEADVAYWQATLARRTLAGGDVAVVELEQRLPEALLLSSPELAERLVQRWLGPVMRLPAGERRPLIDTLETWVLSGGSVRRTAELAHCHRNTVLNRLHRITQLTGHEFDGGEFEIELALALRAVRLLESA